METGVDPRLYRVFLKEELLSLAVARVTDLLCGLQLKNIASESPLIPILLNSTL